MEASRLREPQRWQPALAVRHTVGRSVHACQARVWCFQRAQARAMDAGLRSRSERHRSVLTWQDTASMSAPSLSPLPHAHAARVSCASSSFRSKVCVVVPCAMGLGAACRGQRLALRRGAADGLCVRLQPAKSGPDHDQRLSKETLHQTWSQLWRDASSRRRGSNPLRAPDQGAVTRSREVPLCPAHA
eukprot:3479738-Rhodomonas_salina.3